MIIKTLDITTIKPDINNRILITTNSVIKADKRLVMGAGIAKYYRDNYRDLDLDFGLSVYGLGPNYGIVESSKHEYLYGFQTKVDWRDNSTLEIIKRSLYLLDNLMKKERATSFTTDVINWYITPPGCGLGNLKKQDVYPLIQSIIPDDNLIICEL